MRLWKVVVDGAYREGLKSPIKRKRMTFLLDASNSTMAMEAGELHAETAAKIGPTWLSFESLSAAAIELPFQL